MIIFVRYYPLISSLKEPGYGGNTLLICSVKTVDLHFPHIYLSAPLIQFLSPKHLLKMIRTIWLCKNELFASSLGQLLRNYGISIVTATDPNKALPYFEAIEADLIIIDANWNRDDHEGISILAGLRKHVPGIRAIFVTTAFQPRLCTKLEEAGAMGYFYRNSGNIENIVHCIRQVHAGIACFGETDPALIEAENDMKKRA